MKSKCKISFSIPRTQRQNRRNGIGGSELSEPQESNRVNNRWATSHMRGAKFPNRIVMKFFKFCIAISIIHANFGDHQFMRFRIAGGLNFRFFIDFQRPYNTLAIPFQPQIQKFVDTENEFSLFTMISVISLLKNLSKLLRFLFLQVQTQGRGLQQYSFMVKTKTFMLSFRISQTTSEISYNTNIITVLSLKKRH